MRKDRRAYSFLAALLDTQLRWCLPIFLTFLLYGCSIDGQESKLPPPTGHFEGPLTYKGTELRASLDLREVQPGQLQGEIRLADRQDMGLPAQQITYQHPHLTVRWATGASSSFTVDLTREGDFLKGKFAVDSTAADILLVRRGAAEPLPYRQQQLKFNSRGSSLAGTLLVPDDTLQTHPAVVVLQNAPQQTALSVQLLTDVLVRQGFVVLFTTGRPAASATPANSDSLAVDVLAAARALGHVAGVDSSRVGLIGSSSGAIALATAAVQDDKNDSAIRFVIAVGAPGTSNAAREAEQTTQVLRKQGASIADQRLVALTRGQLEEYVQREGRGDTSRLHRNLRKIAPQPWAKLTGLPTRVPTRAELEEPRWRELAFDPRRTWAQVRVPVLLLYGGADTTLNVQASATRLRGSAGSRSGSAVRVYPGANEHLLLPMGANNGKWQWPRPAPGYVDDLIGWLRERL